MRGFRHDMRSHLANISLLVKGAVGSVKEELESYVGKNDDRDTQRSNAGQDQKNILMCL